ncbi:MAG TPA: aldo/keto reductase [Candidatus Solibacter sp.]|jgi:aryl-alcohol dehydrogenase-like predicted oxidoreductase
MNRREFLQVTSSAALAAEIARADTALPMATLGKSGLRVTRLTLGGAHMRYGGEENAIRIIHRALDLGINFFDSAAKYNDGESDASYGKAISPAVRKNILLMSKAQLRTRDEAMAQLETTLRRMKTDYLDLWQCHEVVTHAEVDKIFGPNGSLEAFVAAKKQGKVRHIGFTGHADPEVHLRLLAGYDGWETVQHPVNLIDPHYLSFIDNVLPKVRAKGLGLLAMKCNAMGAIGKNDIATYAECLRFSLSQDVDTVVSGATTVEELEQNVATVKAFHKMTPVEQSEVLARTKKGPIGVKVENYKRPPTGGALPAHSDGERG